MRRYFREPNTEYHRKVSIAQSLSELSILIPTGTGVYRNRPPLAFPMPSSFEHLQNSPSSKHNSHHIKLNIHPYHNQHFRMSRQIGIPTYPSQGPNLNCHASPHQTAIASPPGLHFYTYKNKRVTPLYPPGLHITREMIRSQISDRKIYS